MTAKGVFRELLDLQWALGGLPEDPAGLRRMIGATESEWECWRSHVQSKFPLDGEAVERLAVRSILFAREGNERSRATAYLRGRYGALPVLDEIQK